MPTPIEPHEVVSAVESYVASQLHAAQEYENRSLLDESGISELHHLAAEAYALGFADGAQTARVRESARRHRERSA